MREWGPQTLQSTGKAWIKPMTGNELQKSAVILKINEKKLAMGVGGTTLEAP